MSRESILDRLVDQHEARINKVLYTLEDDIVSSIVNSTKNNVVSTQIAIQLRPQLKALIEKNFLKEADAVIRDYDKVVDEFMKEFGVLNIPDEFKTLTQANLETITALKYQTFRGFEDVAGRFLNVIGDEVYQSAIAGKPFNETVKAIRGAINGVYQRSNEEAINRLTRYIDLNRYSSDPLKVARVKEARKILHTKYASDILGNNMRRYAGQIAHDSLMQFDGSFILSKAKEAGLNNFKYSGSLVTDSRDFCRRNQGRTFTQDEANKKWQTSWVGKSSSDPFTARGGYRCRHHWLVVIVEEKKPEEKPTNIFGEVANSEKELLTQGFGTKISPASKVISLLPPLKKYEANGRGFYRGSEDLLNHGGDKSLETFIHEYGHRIDRQLAVLINKGKNKELFDKLSKNSTVIIKDTFSNSKLVSIAQLSADKIVLDAQILAKNYRKRSMAYLEEFKNNNKNYEKLASEIKTVLSNDEIITYLQLRNQPFEIEDIYDFKLKLKYKLLNANRYNTYDKQFSEVFNDYLGAITKEKIGGGHGVSYYNKFRKIHKSGTRVITEGQTAEAFAEHTTMNYNANKQIVAIEKKLMNHYAPNTTAEYDLYYKEFGEL